MMMMMVVVVVKKKKKKTQPFKLHVYSNYEGWNFNSGYYLFTTDTK